MAKTLSFDKIRARLDSIADGFVGQEAKVGWFPAAKYADGTPVAYVAAIQENGVSARGIPPRPFIRPTIADRRTAWVDTMTQGMRAVVKGKATAEQVLEGVGLAASADIGITLASGQFVPLSPITLMLRRMRDEDPTLVVTGRVIGEAAARVKAGEPGSSRTQPLHDTGLMVSTLTHLVGATD